MKSRINPDTIKVLLIAAAVSSPFSAAIAGKFYKCFNEDGELVYQQVACDSDVKQETVHVFTAPDQRSQLGPSVMGEAEYVAQGDEPATVDPLRFQAGLSNVLGQLSPIKIAVQQYYMINGNWPESPAAMGFNENNLTSSDITGILMADEGAIVVGLSERFGNEKKLVLAPRLIMDGTSLEWQCQGNFPASALTLSGIPICQSRTAR
ncbi:MAG: pilin [Candidatus Thiodiazotropha sp.]